MSARLVDGGPCHIGEKTFLQEAVQSLLHNAENTFLIDSGNGKSLTFREVHEKASAISAELHNLGLRDGDIVPILSNCTVESYIVILGVWLSGATSTAINPLLPTNEIHTFLKICKARVAYVGHSYLESLREAEAGLDWDVTVLSSSDDKGEIDVHQIFARQAELVTQVHQPLGKDHCMAIFFTSGTTGGPKGVMLRDESSQFGSTALPLLRDRDFFMASSPLYWISSCFTLCFALKKGIKVLLTDRASPKRLLEVITQYKPTTWFTGPTMLLDMCNIPDLTPYDTSSLTCLIVGGSVLFPNQRRLITERLLGGRHVIYSAYGSTEGSIVSIDRLPLEPSSPNYASIGQVANGVLIKIVDTETGDILPPMAVGEICVKSPGIIKSYINKEITEKELDRDGFWHMGDLGYYTEDNYIFYKSRDKDIMKYKGQQIAPAELEQIILRLPEVAEVAVVGKPSEECGELPAAFVVLHPDSRLTKKELFDFVSNNVIEEKKLRGGIYFMESLPKSPVGKILRRELMKTLPAE